MTPEQKASQPEHPEFGLDRLRDLGPRLDRLTKMALAIRVIRAAQEYPQHHPERHRLPPFVKQWEKEHGPAPASAEKWLRENTQPESGR